MVFAPFVDVVGGISSSVNTTTNLIVPDPANNLRTGYQPQLSYPPGINMPDPPTTVCSGPAASRVGNNVTGYTDSNGTSQLFRDAGGSQIVDNHGSAAKFDEYSPGVITSNLKSMGNIYFEPGTYCLTGGFDLNANQIIWGQNVLLYVAGSAPCNFSWNGGAQVDLAGIGLQVDGSTVTTTSGYKGLLIYVSYARGGTPQVFWSPQTSLKAPTFNGNQSSAIIGTIYAPTCNVQLTGTGGNFYQGQMIGYTATLIGNSTIFMNYNPDKNITVQNMAKVDLSK
jgi:hypothetical protein